MRKDEGRRLRVEPWEMLTFFFFFLRRQESEEGLGKARGENLLGKCPRKKMKRKRGSREEGWRKGEHGYQENT